MGEKKSNITSIVERVQLKMDGWMNILSGFGVKSRDHRRSTTVTWFRMSEADIEHLYAAEPIAAKIVDLPVEEATMKGYKITGIEEEGKLKALEDRLRALHFDQSCQEAWRKARMYGGAAILKVYDDKFKLDQPATSRILKALVVLQRFELWSQWEDVQKDLMHPDFGCPVIYTFFGRMGSSADGGLRIHYSRLVRFNGAILPDRLKQTNGYWDDSVFGKLSDVIRNYAESHDAISAAIKDLSVAVYKIKGLADQVASGDDTAVTNRLQIVNMSKSIARAVILDADGETFEYQGRTLTGATDLVKKTEDRLAAASSIPSTVLYGGSPVGGLGQSGNHESENWYSWIEAQQRNYLKPNMLEIIRDVAVELDINPDGIDVEFNPLWQMSEKEVVEMRAKQAEADQKYIDSGVVDPVEIADSRFGDGKYSIETKLDMSLRKSGALEPVEVEESEIDPKDDPTDDVPEPKDEEVPQP